jgi:hypothetical protein
VYSKEELIFLIRSLQLENKKISLSLHDVYEDLGTSHNSLNDRMDQLVKIVGERSDSDDSSSKDLV